MKWWSELWLKEGFASLLMYVFVEELRPELRQMRDYLINVTNLAFGADEVKSSHSIEIEINDPCELDSYYDSITYQKSNAVLSMIYNYLGGDVFKAGLRQYIKKFAYSNTDNQDLWAALSNASGQNINGIMDGWIKQMGFPLIIVDEEKLGGNKRRLKLKQTRYLADGTTDDQVWQIPLTFIKSSKPNEIFHKLLFTQREQVIELDGITDNEWIKLNFATTGFYRVQYSNDMLERLLKAVASKELKAEDRFGLASDLVALVESGRVPADQLLGFFTALTDEDEYIVWSAVSSGVYTFLNLFDRQDTKLNGKLKKLLLPVVESVCTRIGWTFKKDDGSCLMLYNSQCV